MVKDKKIVCRCEDITEEEIIEAIHEGYTDIESLKRYVGFTTGPCQGKSCLYHVIRILARETGKSIEEIGMTVPRQPIKPVPFAVFAGQSDEEEEE